MESITHALLVGQRPAFMRSYVFVVSLPVDDLLTIHERLEAGVADLYEDNGDRAG